MTRKRKTASRAKRGGHSTEKPIDTSAYIASQPLSNGPSRFVASGIDPVIIDELAKRGLSHLPSEEEGTVREDPANYIDALEYEEARGRILRPFLVRRDLQWIRIQIEALSEKLRRPSKRGMLPNLSEPQQETLFDEWSEASRRGETLASFCDEHFLNVRTAQRYFKGVKRRRHLVA